MLSSSSRSSSLNRLKITVFSRCDSILRISSIVLILCTDGCGQFMHELVSYDILCWRRRFRSRTLASSII
jgi:hypothetical protein